MKDWIIGIDVAADGICFQIENQRPGRVARGKAASTLAGFERLELACRQAGLRWEETLVLVESTGRYHLPWCERLHGKGAAVFAVNPLVTKKLPLPRNAIRENKDDSLDAATLCHIGRVHAGEIASFRYRPEESGSRLRSLHSVRKCLRSQLTNTIKAASDLLWPVFPEFRSLKLDLCHLGFCSLLREAPSPARIAALPDGRLEKAVGKKAGRLRELCRESLGCEELAGSCATALVHMLETIEDLRARIRRIDAEIREQVARAGGETRRRELLIRSLPGFGAVTAPAMAAFLPEGFENWGSRKKIVAKLQAHFGCDPRRRQSGRHAGKTKVSKRGCGYARTTLFQASFCAIKHDRQMREYYREKRAKGQHHKKAVLDLARKNLRRIVAVILEDQPFEPTIRNA